jgi:stress-induced-phosphoprotein 1
MEKAIEAKNRGNAAFSAKEYDKAVEAFTEAIQYDPDNYVLYSNRSAAFASLGKYHEALEDANSCIQRKPDWPKVNKCVYITNWDAVVRDILVKVLRCMD